MAATVRIIPWLEGQCSLYAVVRDHMCLADEFMVQLRTRDPTSALELSYFLSNIRRLSYVRESLLRPERPEVGVYAMYNHKEIPYMPYNPSRLLCSYVGSTNNILVVGAGFVKSKDEPIQANLIGNREALYLAGVSRTINARIETGEIITNGSRLLPMFPDSFNL